MSILQRLYPDDAQVSVLTTHSDHDRFLRNLVIEQHQFCTRYRPYRLGKRTSWPKITDSRELADLRSEVPWLAEGSSVVQQQALRRTRRAYENWWAGRAGRPRFKKADGTHSFQVADPNKSFRVARLNRHWGTVTIPKAGAVRFRITRPWADIKSAKSIQVTCNRAGQWHVSFVTLPPTFERISTGATVGIDRGVANTTADSDGNFAHIPGLTQTEQSRYLRLTRRAAKQQRGSNRRATTLRQRAKITQRLNDRRTNWIEQTTTRLVRDHDLIALERLQITNMVASAKGTVANPGRNVQAKASLNRAIHASCWGRFADRLRDKADRATSPVIVIEVPAAGTSITCAACGHRAKNNRESQAVFACQACGYTAHADTNAARNILTRAINQLGDPPSGSAGAGRGGLPTRGPAKRQTSHPGHRRQAAA